MDIKRMANESLEEWKFRLCVAKIEKAIDLDWCEIKDMLNLDCSSDHLRKTAYGIYEYDNYIKNKNIDNIEDYEILEEIKRQKEELEKEKIKVQTENLTKRQINREVARYELFTEHAINEIKKQQPIVVPEIKIPKTNTKRSGLLLFGDAHYGKELEIKSLTGTIMNKYSPEIFEQRMWELLQETVRICRERNFNHISIFELGDELEGILRMSILMSLKYGVVESAIRYSRFIAHWLNEITKQGVAIDYYSTYGNHTELRLLTGKKGDFPLENISKMIVELTGEILRDNKNINIIKNHTDKIYTKIQGYSVLGIHGEEKDVQKAIRDFNFIYPENTDYIAGAHKHHTSVVNCGFRKGYIGVGSIIGIDDYSMDLKRVSDPTATFVVFEENKGKVEELTIVLD